MMTIDKDVIISKTNRKIEFELNDLPEGKYRMHLVIDADNNMQKKVDFSSWKSDLTIPPHLTFSREEIYGDDEI